MVTTTQKQKNIAIDFMDTFRDLYLEINNLEERFGKDNLEALNEIVSKMRDSELIKKTENQEGALVKERSRLTRAQMMKDKNYKLCTRCDSYVLKKNFNRHRETSKKCLDILTKKVVCKKNKTLLLNQYDIVENEDIDKRLKNLNALKREEKRNNN